MTNRYLCFGSIITVFNHVKLHLLYRALRELLSLRLSGAAQSVRYLVSII